MAKRTIRNIPLDRLHASEDNARRSEPEPAALKQLKASIRTHDLLQNLVVRDHGARAEKRYQVTGGRHRLTALQALAAEGEIPADFSVPCRVTNGDASDLEVSLTENEVRVAMSPVDVHCKPAKAGELRRARIIRISSQRFDRVSQVTLRVPEIPSVTFKQYPLSLDIRRWPSQTLRRPQLRQPVRRRCPVSAIPGEMEPAGPFVSRAPGRIVEQGPQILRISVSDGASNSGQQVLQLGWGIGFSPPPQPVTCPAKLFHMAVAGSQYRPIPVRGLLRTLWDPGKSVSNVFLFDPVELVDSGQPIFCFIELGDCKPDKSALFLSAGRQQHQCQESAGGH